MAAPETGGRTDTIDAPVDKIVDALLDFDSYPEWSANMPEVRGLDRDADDRPSLVEFHVDAKVRRIRYVARYTYDLPDGFDWEMVEGDVKALRGGYRFVPEQIRTAAYRRLIDSQSRPDYIWLCG